MPEARDFIIFGSPRIEEPEIHEVVECIKSGWLSTGPRVARFEQMFQDYIGSPFAVALNSCSAGLHLSLLAAGIGPGDEVITTPMTFAATANAIVHVGARPVFVDIDVETMNMAPDLIESKITPRTKAILPVHLAGRPCEMDAILEISAKHNLLIIEDAAHALEAVYRGKKIGTIGDFTAFSFYVTKNIVAGEGGIVTTRNKEWAEKVRILSQHGLDKCAWQRFSDANNYYQVILPGFKYNMMDLQAALLLHQLPRVENYWQIRANYWQIYNDEFRNLPVQTPIPVDKNCKHAYHLYTLLLDLERLSISRDEFRQKLTEQGIGSGIHFLSLHLHPYYSRYFGYQVGDFPNAEYVSERTVSLPLSAKLSEEEVGRVVEAVKNILTNNSKTRFINSPGIPQINYL
ncbi:MAG: DegT/DnrJ/EryC1/StrS family aminotransferase [Calditrichaeota bacterium]|nr:MAG: DegT/DnrJ/EryC1/StrS family aminotransferase [Calditrichota bacterium]